jgi:hypothetical protein
MISKEKLFMVKKYRKKPVTIEAVQFTRDNFDEILEFTNGQATNFKIPAHDLLARCIIPTLEGGLIALEYDYIIKVAEGEFYPCKPDIFHMTYERAEE